MVMFNVTHPERSPTMTSTKDKPAAAAIKDLLSQSPDALREIVRSVMQEMLEAEMTDALQAEKGERTAARPFNYPHLRSERHFSLRDMTRA
jgi:putative transposase